MGCSNIRSKDYPKEVAYSCDEFWRGAQLEVITRIQATIVRMPKKDKTVIQILTKQNTNWGLKMSLRYRKGLSLHHRWESSYRT